MRECGAGGIAEFVTGGEVRLFVRRFGDPALPLLIVVHGSPGWTFPICSRLLRSWQGSSGGAVRPEWLRSELPDPPGRRAAGVGAADVLGFSYGGRVAMRVVDQHPGLVRGLILASTTAYTNHERDQDASTGYQARAALCPEIG